MINSIKIAFRNTLRNKRRTVLSVLAIAIGGFASLLIGSFVSSISKGIQTEIARDSGHLHIHKRGYFDFGSAKVGKYDIEAYEELIKSIKQSDIARYINVITPTLSISGIASNNNKETSQTFIGLGLIPSDQQKMLSWDGFQVNTPSLTLSLNDSSKSALIGRGLAVNLDMCKELNISECKEQEKEINPNPVDKEMSMFLDLGNTKVDSTIINLLAASSSGAPNIVRLKIDALWEKTQKEIDDRFIAMPLEIAQGLVYGEGTKKVNSINIQLNSPKDIEKVSAFLIEMFKKKNLDLEVIPLKVFNPQFNKIIGMFSVIFSFVSLVIALIAIFTVSNTMTMSIMERYSEIGTLRSMGLRRSGVRTYFLLEGTIIGIMGATLGVIVAIISTYIINNIGLMWTPPSSANPTQLVFNLLDSINLIVGVWALLVFISVISSLLPAIKASKMKIVDALRHT